ncbi:MAG: hypothetical protein MZW92_23780 [Comamonadaceae bacterium]|nr:hypothetical protein [Comamonadaceae bacterium]
MPASGRRTTAMPCGGDEFVVLLPKLAGRKCACGGAKIRAHAVPYIVDGVEMRPPPTSAWRSTRSTDTTTAT